MLLIAERCYVCDGVGTLQANPLQSLTPAHAVSYKTNFPEPPQTPQFRLLDASKITRCQAGDLGARLGSWGLNKDKSQVDESIQRDVWAFF